MLWILTKIHNYEQNGNFLYEGGFVPLGSRYMQKNIGTRHARNALMILLNLGIIEANPSQYRVGHRYRSFRLTMPYEKQEWLVNGKFGFLERDFLLEYDDESQSRSAERENPNV